MLPPHNLVLAQITDVGYAWLAAGFEKHPADVGVPEALVSVVWIQISVGVTVVSTVASGPPLDRTLDGTCASHSQSVLERLRGVVCPVSPQTMIASSDACQNRQKAGTTHETESQLTKASDKVVKDRKKESLGLDRNKQERVYREHRRDGEDENVQPVELIKYIVPSEGGQSLLIFECPRDIIVRYVDVDGGSRVLALSESGTRGGPICHLLGRDGGHGGRGETLRENGDIAVGLLTTGLFVGVNEGGDVAPTPGHVSPRPNSFRFGHALAVKRSQRGSLREAGHASLADKPINVAQSRRRKIRWWD